MSDIIDDTKLETVDTLPAWSWFCRPCQRMQYADATGKNGGPPGIARCRNCGHLVATLVSADSFTARLSHLEDTLERIAAEYPAVFDGNPCGCKAKGAGAACSRCEILTLIDQLLPPQQVAL